jgi:hypothetical protein
MDSVSLIIQNNKGQAAEYATVVTDIEWTTDRLNSPGKLTFTLSGIMGNEFDSGSVVLFKYGGVARFYGYVFSRSVSNEHSIEVIAYDQLRYLQGEQSFTFKKKRADQSIKSICNFYKLRLGTFKSTSKKIKSFVAESTSGWDAIQELLYIATQKTGIVYNFYDDAGKVRLRTAESMRSDTLLGDFSAVESYSYEASIDNDVYNYVKVVKPDKKKGKAKTYIFRDSKNIKKWGQLQYYEVVDDTYNKAAIKKHGKTLLKYYNRERRMFSIENAQGIIEMRAGSMPLVVIKNGMGSNLQKVVLLDTVTHKFTADNHTMSCDMRL